MAAKKHSKSIQKAFKILWGNAKYYKLVANSFMVKTYKNIVPTLLDFANICTNDNSRYR